MATQFRHARVIQLLRNAKANINAETKPENGDALLILAAKAGRHETVKDSYKLEPIQRQSVVILQVRRFTMLLKLAMKGLLQLLLEAGAKTEATDQSGYTALHEAIRAQNTSVVEQLLNAKANIKCTN